MIKIEQEKWCDLTITSEEVQDCENAVGHVLVSGSVSENYETFKIEIGGDVPEGLEWTKFAKYCINQVNWHRQLFRKKMKIKG